ncbi:MAG: HD domain-containing phosphohydrolase [Bacillota bacterium]
MDEKILLVDDERNILLAYQRRLHGKYKVTAVESGAAGLAAMQKEGPFAVVVADYRMPGLDGIQFLAKAAEKEPDTVRIMLTGHADIDVAINAINEGNIFRFLTKPCPSDIFLKAITAGIKQYRLVKAEHELLDKTLKGSIMLLTDILSITNPAAFGQAARLSRLAKKLAERLRIGKPWEIELAAMLSQVGCVTVPADVLEKYYQGIALTEEEKKMYLAHPQTGKKLLANIPRLEDIARAIEYQFKHYNGEGVPVDELKGGAIPLAARILKVALDFEFITGLGKDPRISLEVMRSGRQQYDPDVFAALEAELLSVEEGYIVRAIHLSDTMKGMLLAEDIKDKNGAVLIPRGFEITELLKTRLLNYARSGLVLEPIKVLEKVMPLQ